MDEIDRGFALSEWITEQTQKGHPHPIVHAIQCLDDNVKQNVLRKWERAVMEETMVMKPDELETFLQKIKSCSNAPACYLKLRTFKYDDTDDEDCERVYTQEESIVCDFKSEHHATQLLFNWCRNNKNLYFSAWRDHFDFVKPDEKNTLSPTLELCADIVRTHKSFCIYGSDEELYFDTIPSCQTTKELNDIIWEHWKCIYK